MSDKEHHPMSDSSIKKSNIGLSNINNVVTIYSLYYFLSRLFDITIALLIFISWILGVVIAKGFFNTLAAIFLCPFYSWYLIIEKYVIPLM